MIIMREISKSLDGTIGQRIKMARKNAGLSQAELARRVGVSQPGIANWESGVHDPRPLMLVRLADALQLSQDWLAAGQRSPDESDPQAAAAYLRRPLVHTPVVKSNVIATEALRPNFDPNEYADDYIPMTYGDDRLFAFFLDDAALSRAFRIGTLMVVDYSNNNPADGGFCCAIVNEKCVVRRWRQANQSLETFPLDGAVIATPKTENVYIVGSVCVSIRFH